MKVTTARPPVADLHRASRRSVMRRLVAAAGLVSSFSVATKLGGQAFAQQPAQAHGVRCVVAANRADGKSHVISDVRAPESALWKTSPDDPTGLKSAGHEVVILPSTLAALDPPAGGTNTMLVSIPPWSQMKKFFESSATSGMDKEGFHRTSTVDHIIVLNGSLELRLDTQDVALSENDVVILCNVRHSWRNLGSTPVRMMVTLVRI